MDWDRKIAFLGFYFFWEILSGVKSPRPILFVIFFSHYTIVLAKLNGIY